jgi:membrane-anchored protein YejM (alkaline phosphatase superfamily)
LNPPSHVTPEQQRARLDHLAWLNEEHAREYPGSSELAARIASYELAYRMQSCAPEAVDLSNETEETKRLYGMDDPITEPFGKQCLLARRLVERGVRFVQLYNGAIIQQNVDTWDAHANLVDNHTMHAREVDRPMAGLIQDLKRSGLLDDTLVIWHSEFGRMPISQRGLGRDHNPGAMTVWMAGAGIQGGQVIGNTDDFGYKAVDPVYTYHDIHASLLHLMGLDHKRLTYFFNGRHMRLTDVHGELIPGIAA